MIESGFNVGAFSRAKAAGPWQFMSHTGKRFGLRIDSWIDERRDYIKATHAAAQYLKELYDQFGQWYLAWAGYNAGGGKMTKAIGRYNTNDFFEIVKGRYLRPETKNYVPKLIAAAIIAKSPKRFGFNDIDFERPWEFETRTVEGPFDLKLCAQALGYDYDELRELNGGLKHGLIPPGQKYELRVPREIAAAFTAKVEQMRPKYTFKTYNARRGESLTAIASRYASSIDLVRAQNNLGDVTRLKHSQELVVPVIAGKKPVEVKEAPVAKATQPKPVAVAAAAVTLSGDEYLVVPGDSLWSISQKCGTDVQTLKRINHITNHRGLQAGQKIKLR
jgi:membrane-bound lytic murein transglycosylase D